MTAFTNFTIENFIGKVNQKFPENDFFCKMLFVVSDIW